MTGQQTNLGAATGQAVDNNGDPVGDPVSATDTGNYFGAAPAITLDKQVNNQDEPTAPGLFVPVGQPVTFTYIVTNTGNVTLEPVTVDDDILGPITCPETSLAPDTSETCTAPGGNATAGPHQNTATVIGQGVDNNGAPVGTPAAANALANDFGEAPSITLTKNVNGQHEPNPPGLAALTGSTITFTYQVTNTGNVTLNPVAVTDDHVSPVTCPQTSLAPGQSMTCTATTPALAGQQTNTATATGEGVDNNDSPVGNSVSTTDTGNYFGQTPAIALVKQINGQHETAAPGLIVLVGTPVTFTYEVTNTGNITLTPVTVTDNILGTITCPQTSLAPTASETCTAAGGNSIAGNHQNTATATGQGVDDTGGPVGSPVSGTDTANYFGDAPAITLTKDVDGQHEPTAPGLSVSAGSTLTFTYVVTNTGNVTDSRISVTDNVLGPIACPKDTLAPGESETCTKTQTAAAGQHVNTATVSDQPLDPNGQPIGTETSASDEAFDTGTTPPPSSRPRRPPRRTTSNTATASPAETSPPEEVAATSSSTPNLAVTGAYEAPLGQAGGILLLSGLAVQAISRRRRRAPGPKTMNTKRHLPTRLNTSCDQARRQGLPRPGDQDGSTTLPSPATQRRYARNFTARTHETWRRPPSRGTNSGHHIATLRCRRHLARLGSGNARTAERTGADHLACRHPLGRCERPGQVAVTFRS